MNGYVSIISLVISTILIAQSAFARCIDPTNFSITKISIGFVLLLTGIFFATFYFKGLSINTKAENKSRYE